VYVCVRVCVCVCVLMCVYLYVCVCVCVYRQTHTLFRYKHLLVHENSIIDVSSGHSNKVVTRRPDMIVH